MIRIREAAVAGSFCPAEPVAADTRRPLRGRRGLAIRLDMGMRALGLSGCFVLSFPGLLFPGLAFPAEPDPYAAERAALVAEVAAQGRRNPPEGQEGFDEAVLQAMREVQRHRFVPPSQVPEAYANHPLPIGHGQTISQPYIVALMTDLVDPQPGDKVLEIGTGSGYQAAVLAKLVDRVYSIEIVEPLAEQARERLAELGYGNVTTRLGDGYFGWQAQAPFDAIVVTAAASHVPPPLIAQLRPGGRMVIPVGGRFAVQYLLLIEKTEAGETITRQITAVRFVPLTGDH